MDFSSLGQLLPLIFQVMDVVKSVQGTLKDGGSVYDKINKIAPVVLPAIEQVGKTLFPGLGQEATVSAGALVLSTDRVKTIQSALNAKGATPPLVVDGVYGQKTKDAAKAFQSANGLDADGWVGPLTAKKLGI